MAAYDTINISYGVGLWTVLFCYCCLAAAAAGETAADAATQAAAMAAAAWRAEEAGIPAEESRTEYLAAGAVLTKKRTEHLGAEIASGKNRTGSRMSAAVKRKWSPAAMRIAGAKIR